jgi:hypothetical protein
LEENEMAKRSKIKGSNRGDVPKHIPHGADDSSSNQMDDGDYPDDHKGIGAITDHTAEKVARSLNAQTNMLRNLTKSLLHSLLENK